MRTSHSVGSSLASLLLLLPSYAFAQDATLTGTITDATGGVLPGVTITATHEATGNTLRGRHRSERRLPSASSFGVHPGERRAARFCDRDPFRGPARPPDRRAQPAVARQPSRVRHGNRRGAAHRHGQLHVGRQRRSAPDAGPAANGLQLIRPDDARAGRAAEHVERHADGRRRQLPAEQSTGSEVTNNMVQSFGQPKFAAIPS